MGRGVFCKKVENWGLLFVKGGPFLNAGCIMYGISIFYFTFYLFGGGCVRTRRTPPLRTGLGRSSVWNWQHDVLRRNLTGGGGGERHRRTTSRTHRGTRRKRKVRESKRERIREIGKESLSGSVRVCWCPTVTVYIREEMRCCMTLWNVE